MFEIIDAIRGYALMGWDGVFPPSTEATKIILVPIGTTAVSAQATVAGLDQQISQLLKQRAAAEAAAAQAAIEAAAVEAAAAAYLAAINAATTPAPTTKTSTK
jgi:hypothetical protein